MLDVGAGGGTISQWFSRHVAPSRSVLAVDLNPRFIMALDEPTSKRGGRICSPKSSRVIRSTSSTHGTSLSICPGEFVGLERLIGAAGPACWWPSAISAACSAAQFTRRTTTCSSKSVLAVVNEARWDQTWAPTIAEHMRQFGLEDVDAESFRRYVVGGDAGSVRINQSVSVCCATECGDWQGDSRSDRRVSSTLARPHGGAPQLRDMVCVG